MVRVCFIVIGGDVWQVRNHDSYCIELVPLSMKGWMIFCRMNHLCEIF